MKKLSYLTMAGVAAVLLGTVAPSRAVADEYYRTYSYTKTVTTPAMPMTFERVTESPVIIERAVEQPVVIEKTVQQPVIIERAVQQPVIIERTVERPVTVDRVIERPVVIESHRRHLLDLNLLHFGLF